MRGHLGLSHDLNIPDFERPMAVDLDVCASVHDLEGDAAEPPAHTILPAAGARTDRAAN